jgi:hypothetical protein
VDTVRDHDDDEVMMWLVFVSFFFGWDGMKWAGLGEMVFAITYFTTATNLTLPFLLLLLCALYLWKVVERGVGVVSASCLLRWFFWL